MTTFLIVFLVSYILHGFGITIGYHRLLSHRSFKCKKFVEYFFVLAGYLAFEGSPIWWAAIHRAHHRHVDTPLDPHSPRYGLAHSYFGWLLEMVYPPHIDPNVQCKDLVADPIYRMLECGGDLKKMNHTNLGINLLFRAVLFVCFGWQVALANLLAAAAVMQIPLMLNVICHIPQLGYKNFATNDDGVNVWWVGLLGLGEGWHNNHHVYPGSARNGMKAHEFDLSYLCIQMMKAFGWVSWLNPGPNMKSVHQERALKLKEAALAGQASGAAASLSAQAAAAASAVQTAASALPAQAAAAVQTAATVASHAMPAKTAALR